MLTRIKNLFLSFSQILSSFGFKTKTNLLSDVVCLLTLTKKQKFDIFELIHVSIATTCKH